MKILIENCQAVISNESNACVKLVNIGIDGKYIKFINEAGICKEDFRADKIINAADKIAIPGFINTHTHSVMTIFRGFASDKPLQDWLFNYILPLEKKLTDKDAYWGAYLAVAEMIKCGTTSFLDMYEHIDSIASVVQESGIRAILTCEPLRVGELKGNFNRAQQQYSRWNMGAEGRIKVYAEIHSMYLHSLNMLKEGVEIAKELGAGIAVHISETMTENDEILKTYGMTPLRVCESIGLLDLPVVAAHCVYLDDADIELLKRKNVSVSHNPSSNLKLGSGIANVPHMIKNGINVSIGTDGAASNNNLNILEEISLAALLHKGVAMDPTVLNAEQVFLMGTLNGAKAMRIDDQVGKLEPGMKADIVLMNMSEPHLNPRNDCMAAIVYSAQGSDVDTVIVDGNILMEKRELKTIDQEKAIAEVNAISKRLLK